MKLFKTKYRIVKDRWLGFEAQQKTWYWPFWAMVDFSNTFFTVQEAEDFIKMGGRCNGFKKEVVWEKRL